MAAVTSAISVGASTFLGGNVSKSQKKNVHAVGKAAARCDMSSNQEQATVSSVVLKSIAIGAISSALCLGSTEVAFANSFDELEARSSVVELYERSRAQKPAAPVVSKPLPTPKAPEVSFDLGLDVDPVYLAAGGVGVAVVAGGAALLGSSKGSKTVSPEKTAALLAAAKSPVVVDLRSRAESLLGSPDLDAKVVTVPYASTAKPASKEPAGRSTFGNTAGSFAERVIKAVGPDASTLVFFDGDGKTAQLAAKEVLPLTKAAVYVVVGGAPAWKAKELPWKAPLGKLPGISLPGLDLSKVAADLKNVDTKKLVEDIKAKAKDVDLNKVAAEIKNVDPQKLVEDIKAKAKDVDTKEVYPLAAAAGIVAGSILLLTNADFIASVGITGAVLYFAYERLLFKEVRVMLLVTSNWHALVEHFAYEMLLFKEVSRARPCVVGKWR
eukprot:jgi/Mesvir1/1979/Mv03482-RA.1